MKLQYFHSDNHSNKLILALLKKCNGRFSSKFYYWFFMTKCVWMPYVTEKRSFFVLKMQVSLPWKYLSPIASTPSAMDFCKKMYQKNSLCDCKKVFLSLNTLILHLVKDFWKKFGTPDLIFVRRSLNETIHEEIFLLLKL